MAPRKSKADAYLVPASSGNWPEVDLTEFLETRSPAPSFPMDALPKTLSSVATSIATARCVNFDYTVVSLLAAASGAIGNRVRLQLTETATEPLALFLALIGEPGDGKSAALNICNKAIKSIDRVGAAPGLLRQDQVAARIDVERNLSARKAIARDGSTVMVDVKENGSEQHRLLLTDFTVAGIRDALVSRPEGAMALAGELVRVMGLAGTGDSVRARGILLQAHDGEPYTFMKARGEEITVPALQLTILGATQPDCIGLIAGKAHDGMVPRFLWCAPDVPRIDALPESDGELSQFIEAVRRLAEIEPTRSHDCFSTTLPISVGARTVLREANEQWNSRMPSATMVTKSLLSRARAQALRLSGVIALTERALGGEDLPGGEISAEDATRGIVLMDKYFVPMGERATHELRQRPKETPSMMLARYLIDLGKTEVNARSDVRRGKGSPLHDPDTIAQAFEELRLRGYVREVPHVGLGRPAKIYQVNPNLLQGK